MNDAPVPDRVQLKQPKGLRVLFMTEMWERFSFYGMKALLTLYLITVVAVGHLEPGHYRSTLEVTESVKESEGKGAESTLRREYLIAVDKPIAPEDLASKVANVGTPLLSLKLAKAQDVDGKKVWVADETDAGGAIPVVGKPKGTFTNDETRLILTNTGENDVEYKAAFDRSSNVNTYFTINDSSTQVVGSLEPGASTELAVVINRQQSGMNWTKERAGELMAWYTGLVYLLPIIGGVLADRYLGTHRCLLIGGSIIALGHFVLMADTLPALYAGLGLVIVGTGFFKSNVSTMVGQLYEDADARRDAGFTIFYMGINMGAFIGPLICGWLRANYGWSWAFGIAGVGMVLGLIQYMHGRRKYLSHIGLPPAKKTAEQRAADNVPLTFEEKQRIGVIFIMAFFVIFFWAAFEQASGSMAYFGQERTDRALPEFLSFLVAKPADGGIAFWPTEWLQSVNPLMILILAPIFAQVWVRLATRGLEPSTPAKMAIGLITLGLGFLFLVFGAQAGGEAGLKVSPLWIFGAFLLHTCGELCLSPVGLSMVTKMAPLKLASALMGIWFLSNFFANFIAARLSGMVDKITETGFLGVEGYGGFFLIFFIFPTAAGIVLLLIVKPLKKMMHGRG